MDTHLDTDFLEICHAPEDEGLQGSYLVAVQDDGGESGPGAEHLRAQVGELVARETEFLHRLGEAFRDLLQGRPVTENLGRVYVKSEKEMNYQK